MSDDVWADINLLQKIDELLGHHEGDDQVVIHLPVGKQKSLFGVGNIVWSLVRIWRPS